MLWSAARVPLQRVQLTDYVVVIRTVQTVPPLIGLQREPDAMPMVPNISSPSFLSYRLSRMHTISRFNVTPVKGMALHHPEQVTLGVAGIPGSRLFYLVDAYEEMFSGWAFGALVQVRPIYDAATERLALTFPDGAVVEGDAMGLGPSAISDFYGRPVPAHEVLGPFAEAITAYVGRPLRLFRCDRDGDAVDVHPLTIVSAASVRDLASRGTHPTELDSRRFRINIEFDGGEPDDEDGWDGRSVRVGEAVLRITGQIPRCVVTTQSPDTGEKDWNTLTQIAKYRPRIPDGGGLPFGMYAHVEQAGTARVGDEVSPLPLPVP